MGERVSRLFPRFAGLDSRESGNDDGIFLVRQRLRVLPENSYPLSAKALGFDSAQASTPLRLRLRSARSSWMSFQLDYAYSISMGVGGVFMESSTAKGLRYCW